MVDPRHEVILSILGMMPINRATYLTEKSRQIYHCLAPKATLLYCIYCHMVFYVNVVAFLKTPLLSSKFTNIVTVTFF